MNVVFVRPKNRIVSKAAIFKSMDDLDQFCEQTGLLRNYFDWHIIPITEKKYARLDKFSGDLMKGA